MSIATKVLVMDLYAVQYAITANKQPKTQTKTRKQQQTNQKQTNQKHTRKRAKSQTKKGAVKQASRRKQKGGESNYVIRSVVCSRKC